MGSALGQNDALPQAEQSSFFKLSARTLEGEVFDFSDMRGRAQLYLVVNLASKAPSARDKMAELSRLYEVYQSKGLEILAFPSNSFRNEFATDQEILSFLGINFKPKFFVFEKTEVNGPDPHPVYAFLRRHGPLHDVRSDSCAGLPGDFTCFVVDGEGKVSLMAGPEVGMAELQEWVSRLLTFGRAI